MLQFDQESEHSAPFDRAQLPTLSNHFLRHFTRYLNGAGHPDHPIYCEIIPLAIREAAKTDKSFRARQFVSQITGTAFLDSPAKKMEVSTHSLSPFKLRAH
jgi:hypothetical protein